MQEDGLETFLVQGELPSMALFLMKSQSPVDFLRVDFKADPISTLHKRPAQFISKLQHYL